MNISDLLSKPIITIYEAQMVGTALTALFDKKMRRAFALLAVSDEDEDEIFYTVPLVRIEKADNALTIKNRNCVHVYKEDPLLVRCPINHSVFSTSGESKGVVRDISYDDSTLEVIALITDMGEIPASSVVSVSDSIVMIKGEGFTGAQAPRKRKSAPKKPKEEKAPLPEIKAIPLVFEDAEEAEETPEDIPFSYFAPSRYSPARIISDYSFLLGRKVLQDVYSTAGDLIIEGGTIIKAETVETARKYGKLVELTVGSRL
jgi:sporulation protein YlmC with PRC-barrel domain